MGPRFRGDDVVVRMIEGSEPGIDELTILR